MANHYILPVFVGRYTLKEPANLLKFDDFILDSYPDTLASNLPQLDAIDLSTPDGIQAALQAANFDAESIDKTFFAIGNLCRLNIFNRKLMGETYVCDLAVSELAKWMTSDHVLASGCRAIHSMALDEDNTRLLLGAGACTVVVDAMNAFPDDANVAKHGAHAICNLASTTRNAEILHTQGASVAMSRVMMKFDGTPDVLVQVFRAISNLSLFPAAKLADENGGRVVSIARKYLNEIIAAKTDERTPYISSCESVVASALDCISRHILTSQDPRSSVASDECLQLMVDVLQHCKRNEDILIPCCEAIQYIPSRYWTNLKFWQSLAKR